MIRLRLSSRKALSCILILACTACGSLLPSGSESRSFFVLQGEGLQDSSGKKLAQVSTERLDAKLLVRNVEANIFIDSHKIVFSESPMTRGYYQFAQWVEPPPKQISTLLVEYLTSLGLFDSVTRVSSLTKGDLQLNLWLREFHHDISEEPGFVVIRLEAELLDVQGRSALSRTEFVVKEAVETYDAVGAVSGFDRGLAQIFDQIGIWLNKELKTI